MRWLLRGAFEDAVRIPFPNEDGFPWRGGVATALTVFACGEFRPNASTEYFPTPFADSLSLPPLGRQDANTPSVFWHFSTPSNSLIATWENALHGRDAVCPTNFQAEFFADGSFVYRYPDHATAYPPVLPFDYDGDGLENSVDPAPEVPGPDAHGTNAQWYNTVCSNILAAAEATNGVSLAWLEGVNSNAYYFVDVVAERGPVPVRFMDASGALPDDPVVVARAGETCRVPLVNGVEYAFTSSVPFTVSPAYDTIGRTPDYTLKIEPREGGGKTVHWPIRFAYRETTDETGCRFTSNGSKLTVFKVELRPQEPATLNSCVNRHTYGVYELVDCYHTPELETVQWWLVGGSAATNSPGGGVVSREGGAVLRCPLTGNGKPLEVSYQGVTYSPLISLQEPTNIVAETWTGYHPEARDPAHAGDIALRLDLYVYPKTVSFKNIALVEVPWTQGGSVTGYYALAEQAAGRYHDEHHGAGVWHNVTNGNFWATDSAGSRSITNWIAGAKTWDIPIGWNVTTTKIAAEANPDTAKILGVFHQHFEIYSDGTVRVDKFGHWVSRGLSSNPNGPDDGVNLLDGNVFNPVTGNQPPSP